MKNRLILYPMDPHIALSIGSTIIHAQVKKQALRILDETYGKEGVDWAVEKDTSEGIVIKFTDKSHATRFKLSWTNIF